MKSRHLRLILNGKSAGRDDVRAAVGHVREQGHSVSVRVTWEAGDAGRFGREAMELAEQEGIDTVIAGGGDGTVNEVISGALSGLNGDQRPPVSFGVLPLGTANDFALGLGIDPGNLPDCLQRAAESPAKPIDVGQVNGRYFVNMATGGFGARITTETDPQLKKLLGGAAYLFTGLHRFSELAACEGRISGPDFSWDGAFLALAIGNGRRAGGGVELCPQAKVDDGLLDLTIIPYPTPDRVPEMLATLFEQGPNALRESVFETRSSRITLETENTIQMNLDGEPARATRFDVGVQAARIDFIV